jgi:hypothetical protein
MTPESGRWWLAAFVLGVVAWLALAWLLVALAHAGGFLA